MKTAIFIKIAPITYFLEKMVNAQRVFLKENGHFLQDRPHLKMINGHFLQDRPHSPHSISLSSVKATNDRIYWGEWVVQKIWTGPGGGTWSGHLLPAWVPPAPAGCPPGYPPHKPGTHHTHSLTQSYIHTERHHKNPKDKSFGKKTLLIFFVLV